MSVLVPVIGAIDGSARRIYLKRGVDTFHWIEDIYREYLSFRADFEAQKWSPLIRSYGGHFKGPGSYTASYIILLEGTRIVPYDENAAIQVVGEALTDDAETSPDLFDWSMITQSISIFSVPPLEASIFYTCALEVEVMQSPIEIEVPSESIEVSLPDDSLDIEISSGVIDVEVD